MTSNKKPGIMIAVGAGPKKPGAGMPPPMFPGSKASPVASKPLAPKMPGASKDDDDLDDGGGIPPEAVSYRSADQKCSTCTFYQGGQCSQLKMPVEDAASCNLFDSGGDDMGGASPDDQASGNDDGPGSDYRMG